MRIRLLSLWAIGVALLGSGTPRATPQEPPVQTITVKGKGHLLHPLLEEFGKQTGMRVEDRRRDKTDPEVSLEFDKTPFWQAVDAVAAKANLSLSIYQGDCI